MVVRLNKAPVVSSFTANGVEFVVVPREEFEALVAVRNAAAPQSARGGARLAAAPAPENLEHDEDAGTARIIAYTGKAIADGFDVVLPEAVWEMLEAGGNPVAVLRRWRGMTQPELARAVPMSQGYLSQIENSRRAPTVKNMVALAAALRVPLDTLVSEQGHMAGTDELGG